MKFIEIWRHNGYCVLINCKDIREVQINGNEFTFCLFSEQTVHVKAWAGAAAHFSNFLSNENSQRVFKFIRDEKEGEK